MGKSKNLENLINKINPHKEPDKTWFLDLLDGDKQKKYEEEHMEAVMQMLLVGHIHEHKRKILEAKEEIKKLEEDAEDNPAETYCKTTGLLDIIADQKRKIDSYRCFFDEPYFARMDLVDPIEGYNSYYIGKKGDVKLEIVDWRAPLARKYYQKSKIEFSINEYDYKTILRRALRTAEGKVLDFKNEFLSVRDYLSAEEIGDRDEEILFDPYLRDIIKNRKEEPKIKDIIETIQEKQYEIITCPEKKSFVLQGCAGSGKTMIMLHRLSYLMYNNEDIKSRDVLVLTPSNSFNAFIDELATILELEKVRTITLFDYFLEILENENIHIKDKIDYNNFENIDYLNYVYSEAFKKDLSKQITKVYDSLFGMFKGDECKEFIDKILIDCKKQSEAYTAIKNSSLRIRRAILGEIKERKEGGLYYTKPFREFMNCVAGIEEFFSHTLNSDNSKNQSYFYTQLMTFYKCGAFIAKFADNIIEEASNSLNNLKESIEKEIVDLKRYKQKIGNVEKYLYLDRIERRFELIKEIEKISEKVSTISDNNVAFLEFYEYVKGEKNFVSIGSSKDFVDIIRFFYKKVVKKNKIKYGMKNREMYRSDAYSLCCILSMLDRPLKPRYSYVFIDEAQDISKNEYEILKKINYNASFNIFGDTEQNITSWRGIKDWKDVFPEFEIYTLNQNYRNTNQIVDFVASALKVDMQSIGFDGPKVEKINSRGISSFFKDKKGLKAVICSDKDIEKYKRKAYCIVSERGRISKNRINLMTVYESKGLEFTSVAVVNTNMTANERYIAYTRALKQLAVIE